MKHDKDKDYYVSGIIQIRVRASDVEQARKRALARQENLNRSPSLIVNFDNISTLTGMSVDLHTATDDKVA